MITLVHFSDLHLGIENYGRLDPQTALSSRLQDFLRSFDAIVDYALGENIDLVLFCGDAYKTRDPTPTYQREFAKRISRLSRAGIPMFLLAGNHDLPLAAGKAHTLEIFDTLDVDNVVVANKLGTQTVETRGGPIQIVAVPWPIRSHLATKDEFKGLKLEEINARLADAIEDLVSEEIDELDPALPTVLAAHGTVFGATYGSERSVLLGQEVIIPSSVVANRAFDYVALGHIHKHQIVRNADPPAVYSGSVERIDFGEEDEQKGFLLVQLEKGRAQFEFVPLEARPFLTIDVEAKGEDPTAEVVKAIQSHDVRDKVVRLIVRTTLEKEPLLKDSEIFQSLEGAFHVAAINKDVERRVRLRLGSRNYEEMTPREILEAYLKVKQVPSERTQVLLRYADELFEDLD
ncbi:MAG: exonuclease subunit SbcD [Anaerolineae bacterium]|nr:exonuclease subunit SbcD [Anaerolineae bacterium]NIN97116.1 exonuclease subunit SbcD [Anaerolineae bacterium]NIQ80089.1 exonuclease subunit SbcD [Anaerolineae bacterium]